MVQEILSPRPAQDLIARRIRGEAAERERELLAVGLPIALRSAQHSWISAGTFEPSWSKRMVMAKWLISGEAEMGVQGKWIPLKPGQVAIYLPSIRHQFRAVAPENEFCWFTIDGPLAEQFVMELGLRAGVYPHEAPPIQRIKQMIHALRDPEADAREASVLAIRAWYDLSQAIRSPEMPSDIQHAQQIIQQELSDPDLSAASIAQRLNYHRGSLSRLFTRHTGMTIIDYVTQTRLQTARGLLLHSDDKISMIGKKCGFRESSYFCRWFRKHAGVTPMELRNSEKAFDPVMV